MTERPLYTHAVAGAFDRAALSAPPQPFTLDDIGTLSAGRFVCETEHATYDGFLQPSPVPRLFVLLSAAGRADTKIHFSRVSWGGKLNGNTLNIEDPMYARHPGLSVGWYYGTDEVSYLQDIAEITRRIAAARGIDNKDILFIGSSASGYAAIYLADALPGSVAFAMNPQITLSRFHYAPRFSGITNIDLKGEDRFGRNSLRRIADNPHSRFFITCNVLSPEDYKFQIQPWLAEAGIAPPSPTQPALVTLGNCHFMLHRTPSNNLHSTLPDIEHLAALMPIMMSGDKVMADQVLPILTSMTHKIKASDDRIRMSFWFDMVHQLQRPGLTRFETDKSTYLRLIPDTMPAGCSYKLEGGATFLKIGQMFVIRDPAIFGDPRIMAGLEDLARPLDGKLIGGKGWRAVSFPPIGRSKLAERMSAVIDSTLEPIRALIQSAQLVDHAAVPAIAMPKIVAPGAAFPEVSAADVIVSEATVPDFIVPEATPRPSASRKSKPQGSQPRRSLSKRALRQRSNPPRSSSRKSPSARRPRSRPARTR